jgi:hypothetical protein
MVTRFVTPYTALHASLCVVIVPMFPLVRFSVPSQYSSQLSRV